MKFITSPGQTLKMYNPLISNLSKSEEFLEAPQLNLNIFIMSNNIELVMNKKYFI